MSRHLGSRVRIILKLKVCIDDGVIRFYSWLEYTGAGSYIRLPEHLFLSLALFDIRCVNGLLYQWYPR